MSHEKETIEKKTTWEVDMSNDASIKEVIKELKKRRKGRISRNLALHYIFKVYKLAKEGIKDQDIKTSDHDLGKQCICAFRFLHQTDHFCGKDAPKIKKLETLKICLHCKRRMDDEIYLGKMQDIQKASIHERQLKINAHIDALKQWSYADCKPERRYNEMLDQDEIKSDKCPNPKMKNDWHLEEMCDHACKFRRVLKKEKIKREA